MEKIKLGIIGIGDMCQGHASNIKNGECPEIELTAIADIDEDRLRWSKAQNYGDGITYFREAEKHPEVVFGMMFNQLGIIHLAEKRM